MKPKEKKSERVFRIIHRGTGTAQGSYSRACCDEYDFDSASQARSANCHGRFQNHEVYSIAEYEVTYKLIDSDVDGKCSLLNFRQADIEPIMFSYGERQAAICFPSNEKGNTFMVWDVKIPGYRFLNFGDNHELLTQLNREFNQWNS